MARIPGLCALAVAMLAAAQAGSAGTLKQTEATVSDKMEPGDLEALTLAGARARFGVPAATEEFVLNAALPEFRVELLNLFNAEEIAAGDVRITEATWPISAEKNRTFWFRRDGAAWRYIYHQDWNKDDEF